MTGGYKLSAMSYRKGAIAVTEELARREAVDWALTNCRLQGTLPSEDTRGLMECFVEGEVTEAELLERVLQNRY